MARTFAYETLKLVDPEDETDHIDIRWDEKLGYVYVNGEEQRLNYTGEVGTENTCVRLDRGQARYLGAWLLEVTA